MSHFRMLTPAFSSLTNSIHGALVKPAKVFSHSATCRIDAGTAAACATSFERLAERLGVSSSSVRFYTEFAPVGSDDATAARWTQREASRTLQSSSILLRVTLVMFHDGVSDLVIVGLWPYVNSVSLREALQFIAGRRTAAPALPRADTTQSVLESSEQLVTPEWGLGGEMPGDGTGVINSRCKGGVSPKHIIAALALVCTRFDQCDSTSFTMIDGTVKISDKNALSLIQVDIPESCTVSDLLSHPTARSTALGEISQGATHSAISIFLDRYDTDFGEDTHYYPCLTPPFPLTVYVCAKNETTIGVSYHYDRRFFSAAVIYAIDAAIGNFCTQLKAGEHNAHSRRVCELEILNSEGRSEVLRAAPPVVPASAEVVRIEQKISAIAQTYPDAKAVSYNHETITYADLDRRADEVAVALTKKGIRPGDIVGVCLDRSIELIVVLLGIMKAGGAYLPLEPMNPPERISYTLADAAPSLIVADGPRFPDFESVTVSPQALLGLGADVDSINKPSLDPASAAYIIYTSGSTGRPKGVVVNHRNVASLVSATNDEFSLSQTDVWTMFHSVAFDFSVWEIWGCLMTGGHLIVVPHWVCREPNEFAKLLFRENVTVLNQTPSSFSQLRTVEAAMANKLAVRLVIFGGEPLDPRILLPWFDRYPEVSCRMVNMFGITETTVHVTAETVTRRHALTNSKVVGRPIAGWQVLVMDAYKHLLPIGIPGEIYVGGRGVADRYLNRPDLTSERFVPNPYADDRLYRSGDRGRMLKDGRLEHLGRLDNQVKIRGYRIELEEIRSVLLENPAVTAASLVVSNETEGGIYSARIDAYVVLNEGDVASVRRHASRLLPEYMVPSTVTVLDELPLTINGKLDTSRLPKPSTSVKYSTQSSDERVENLPLSCEEKSLSNTVRCIWSEVLGSEVNLDDNFFDLGGNSLLAIRVATSMRNHGLQPIPVRELYMLQTLRKVIDFLESKSNVPH